MPLANNGHIILYKKAEKKIFQGMKLIWCLQLFTHHYASFTLFLDISLHFFSTSCAVTLMCNGQLHILADLSLL